MKLIQFCFFIVFFSSNAQLSKNTILHHDLLYSHGMTASVSSGYVVTQSIGQLNPIGTFQNSNLAVQQGFQQYISNAFQVEHTQLELKVYPNPFTKKLNFEFLSEITNEIQADFFDTAGRLVFTVKKTPVDNRLTIDSFENLQEGLYFIHLSAISFDYSTQLIKIN